MLFRSAVVEGLEVDADAMRRNIDMTQGLVMSEAVMMGLGKFIGREYAHDLVYDICREAVKQQRPLLDLLCENSEINKHLDRAALAKQAPLLELLVAHPEINKHVDRQALQAMLDPANYLGQSGVMVDRVLALMPA